MSGGHGGGRLSGLRRRFAILDRDGTVIVERHYLSDPDEVALCEHAAQGLRRLSDLGVGLVLVTNQSAVGRGMFDAARLDEIHARLVDILAAEDVVLDGIYVCPHRPDEDCPCRKPGAALVERAAREHDFDPADAFVIGDKASDIELGRRIGAVTILVRTGYGALLEAAAAGTLTEAAVSSTPDHVIDDLEGAARVIGEALAAAGRAASRGSEDVAEAMAPGQGKENR